MPGMLWRPAAAPPPPPLFLPGLRGGCGRQAELLGSQAKGQAGDLVAGSATTSEQISRQSWRKEPRLSGAEAALHHTAAATDCGKAACMWWACVKEMQPGGIDTSLTHAGANCGSMAMPEFTAASGRGGACPQSPTPSAHPATGGAAQVHQRCTNARRAINRKHSCLCSPLRGYRPLTQRHRCGGVPICDLAPWEGGDPPRFCRQPLCRMASGPALPRRSRFALSKNCWPGRPMGTPTSCAGLQCLSQRRRE